MKKVLIVLFSILLFAALFAGPMTADSFEPPVFLSITGVVTQVGEEFIQIEDEAGNPTTLLVSEATCYPFEQEIGVGDKVTGYYRFSPIMPLIFPPQYTAEVVVAGMPEDQSIHVDRFSTELEGFEGMLVSEDGMLALRIDENTQIVTSDGEGFDGELNGLDLVVIYDVSTRSIPAQTTPIAIIVLR
ncbi:MAG: hypothetical protein FWD25_05910 [Clostridia bacterium]|nr:hypothetical protein [Clostridia bacterium]